MFQLKAFRSAGMAVWLLIVPILFASVYYAFFAVDRYVSSAKVVVRQVSNAGAPQVPGLAVMLGVGNPVSREETLYLREFVTSMDMLNILEEQIQWRAHYADQLKDPLYYVSNETMKEDLLKFYQRLVTSHFDETTGLLLIEVQALSPDFAQKTLELILKESEKFVNEISHRMARVQMKFAMSELEQARLNYEDRRDEMLVFQRENNLLDAEAAAKGRATIISELETSLTKERASLRGLLASLHPGTPQVRQQQTRIRALEEQLVAENKKLVSGTGSGQLNIVASKFRNLVIDASIAEEAYKFGVTAVETSRIEANKQIRSLVTVVAPNTPELALFPRPIYNLITLFFGLLLIYGIARFIVATIEDHRD